MKFYFEIHLFPFLYSRIEVLVQYVTLEEVLNGVINN